MNKNQIETFASRIDENNRFIINMTVIDKSSFLSPFCGDEPIISSEVSAYLENTIKYVPPTFDFSIKIKNENITEQEKLIYKQAIKNYYHNNIQKLKRDVFRNNIVSLGMTFVGVLVIAIMLILSSKGVINEVWNAVLEIIGWVFIWEAVDKFFFERHHLKTELRLAHKIVNSNISFVNEVKNE